MVVAVDTDVVESLRAKFEAVLPHLDERQQRLVLAAEAVKSPYPIVLIPPTTSEMLNNVCKPLLSRNREEKKKRKVNSS